jgi:hypothetical protein
MSMAVAFPKGGSIKSTPFSVQVKPTVEALVGPGDVVGALEVDGIALGWPDTDGPGETEGAAVSDMDGPGETEGTALGALEPVGADEIDGAALGEVEPVGADEIEGAALG